MGRLTQFPAELCRNVPTIAVLRARSGSDEFTLKPGDKQRQALLARARDGEVIELELDIEAFNQIPGVQNANCLRIKDSKLSALAKSFKGVPLLRDHEHNDLLARAGTVMKSKSVPRDDGGKAFEQTVLVTAKWAVIAVLELNLDRFSIGWKPGPRKSILCSACGTPIRTECYHWPGDVLEDGSVVEYIFTEPRGVETSAVSVPAVDDTGISEIRAALSQSFDSVTPITEDKPMKNFATALGLKADADEATVTAALQANLAKGEVLATQVADLNLKKAKVDAELAAANARIVELEKSGKDRDVDTLMAANADRFPVERDADGKVVRSKLEEKMRALAAKDIDFATEFMADLPTAAPVAGLQTEGTVLNTAVLQTGKDTTVHSAELSSQLDSFGLSAEDYAKFNPINGTDVHN